MTAELPRLSVRSAASVSEVAAWDDVAVGGGAIPFLHRGFLSALEDAGTIGRGTGWATTHLVASARGADDTDQVIAIAPAFVKAHSMGEFVYDWSWAEASDVLGVPYYPKLVLAAPFSPVTGERLLVARDVPADVADQARVGLLQAAILRARELDCAGVHLLFCTDAEVRLAERLGFVHRLGCQFHWDNPGYADFEAFLARFDSKRRNQIRRERRRVRDQGVEVRCYAGAEVEDAFAASAYDFYEATIRRFAWGRRYFSRRFFDLLWQRMRPYLQVVLATRGKEIVGGSLNLEGAPASPGPADAGVLRFGRYWGALGEVHSLHFEVCAYAAIEDCIRRGIAGFEAGAGGEEHKLTRGFLPHPTHSAHLLFEPRLHDAVSDYCRREAAHIEREIAAAEVFIR